MSTALRTSSAFSGRFTIVIVRCLSPSRTAPTSFTMSSSWIFRRTVDGSRPRPAISASSSSISRRRLRPP